jgi:hypothetical protein
MEIQITSCHLVLSITRKGLLILNQGLTILNVKYRWSIEERMKSKRDFTNVNHDFTSRNPD